MDLPNNEVEWRLLLKSEQIEHVSIHDGLHTNSASGIALKQFLLLRVLCKDARKLDPSKWLDGECLETARSRLINGETGWGTRSKSQSLDSTIMANSEVWVHFLLSDNIRLPYPKLTPSRFRRHGLNSNLALLKQEARERQRQPRKQLA